MSWDELVDAGLARRHVPLAPHTTYKLGGPADLFVDVDHPEQLRAAGEALRREPRSVLVLGRGSNLLVADTGFPGVVIRLGASFATVTIDEEGVVVAGGSLSLPRLARAVSQQGRGGLEWCVGVPGSVGGAVRQNAGCFGREVVDVLVDADVVSLADGVKRTLDGDALDLSYRQSAVAATDVVVGARFHTDPVDPARAADEMKEVTRWRRDHQPGGTLNAGSIFKNPPGERPAGAIIDDLGLKGFSTGQVRVSPRHANFIEAEAGATATQVHELIVTVAARVEAATGVTLEPEVQFVGFEEGS